MINRPIILGLVALLLSAAIATIAWRHADQVVRNARTELTVDQLRPMAATLQANLNLMRELQAARFTEPDAGILESYLIRIRRDGVPKHAEMKQMLDQLAENNTTIVTLIQVHAPHAKKAAYTMEADKFRNYASAWRDRWNSVMELFMAGGNYATSGVALPKDFAAAIDTEMAAGAEEVSK